MRYYYKLVTIEDFDKKLMKLIYSIYNKNVAIINYRIDDIWLQRHKIIVRFHDFI